MLSRAEALKTVCPVCGAGANAACKGPKGNERWSLHADRRAAAIQAAALLAAPVSIAAAKRRKSPTDAEILDWLEKRAFVEFRDGGWSALYVVAIPKMAMGPWQRWHGGGEYDHKTLREAIAAHIKKATP